MASDLIPNANLMGPDSVDPRLGHSDKEEERIVDPELFDSEFARQRQQIKADTRRHYQ